MNWQTKAILNELKKSINDESVFSPDQIAVLQLMIDSISSAIEKESHCKGHQSGGQGFF